MSNIRQIFTNLAAKAVTVSSSVAYGTKAPQVFDLNQLPDSADSAKLPARLLLPLGARQAEGKDFIFIALGNTTKVTWRVYDLLLWRKVDEGIGIASSAADLVKYAAAYVTMLRGWRDCGDKALQAYVNSANLTVGLFEYPEESAMWFFGVEVALDIVEVLSG